MASLRPGHPKQPIADRDLATRHHLGVDPHIDMAERSTEGCDDVEISLSGDGIDLVAAHLVIGEITRSRACPRMISVSIQSCSLQAAAPSK